MGCAYSKCNDGDISCAMTTSNTTSNINDLEVDLSHFNVSSKTLGVGGFGIVRSARKMTGNDKGKEYAMKTMCKSSILKRTSGPQCVLTELRALGIMSGCKFVCNVHYGFQDVSHLYMVIDIAPGGDMRYNLRATQQFRFPEAVARLYICQVFIALEFCHQSNILHRDVKPENILMSELGYLKLTDFGVAKILPNIEECKSTSGTHGYMAPEIYEGDHIHGTPAEWFATGVTLHEFLTGRRPFEVFKLQSYRGHTRYPEDLTLEFLDNNCSYLSLDCKDFLHLILRASSVYRLGSVDGLTEIAAHPWMSGVDWSALREFRHPAPFLPDISQTRCDVSAEDMKKVVQQSLLAQPLSEKEQQMFAQYEHGTKIHSTAAPGKTHRKVSASSSFEAATVAVKRTNTLRRSVSADEVVVPNQDSNGPSDAAEENIRKRVKVNGKGVATEHRVTSEEESKPLTEGPCEAGDDGERKQQTNRRLLTEASDSSNVSRINAGLSNVLKASHYQDQPLVRFMPVEEAGGQCYE